MQGSAGTLGAVRVLEAAGALSEATRRVAAREQIDRCYAALKAELPMLIENIRRELGGGMLASAEAGPERLEDILRRLEHYLEIGDIAASELALQERTRLRCACGDDGERLLKLIAAFDYEKALAVLRRSRIDGIE